MTVYSYLQFTRRATETDLAKELSLTVQQLRRQVDRERMSGQPICDIETETGECIYYVAQNAAEYTLFCRRYMEKAQSMMKIAWRLEKSADGIF